MEPITKRIRSTQGLRDVFVAVSKLPIPEEGFLLTVRPYVEPQTCRQRGFLEVVLTRWCVHQGKLTKEAKNAERDRILAQCAILANEDGSRRSTTELNKDEMSDLIEQFCAYLELVHQFPVDRGAIHD